MKGRARRAATGRARRRPHRRSRSGTHALIQEAVAFARLGLAIVDEQHRFGVLQRAALQRRGGRARRRDMLVMTATPIPRTLALTLYGDLDVSTLDELPPGRTPVTTDAVPRVAARAAARAPARGGGGWSPGLRRLPAGRGIGEERPPRRHHAWCASWRAGPLAGLRLGLVHGRMRADEKDAVMRRFKARRVRRAGLHHGHRGRHRRAERHRDGHRARRALRPGAAPPAARAGRPRRRAGALLPRSCPTGCRRTRSSASACSRTRPTASRIAEADLELRGPGDFLGTRQAGLPPFRVANLLRDTELLRAARDEAAGWLARDPTLVAAGVAALRAVLHHRWAGRLDLAKVG